MMFERAKAAADGSFVEAHGRADLVGVDVGCYCQKGHYAPFGNAYPEVPEIGVGRAPRQSTRNIREELRKIAVKV